MYEYYRYLVLKRAGMILLNEILLHCIGNTLRDRLLVKEVDFPLSWVYIDIDGPRVYLQTTKASTISQFREMWDDETLDRRRERRPLVEYWCTQLREPSSCAAIRPGDLGSLCQMRAVGRADVAYG